MKKLIDYKEEIHKCSKCGLCQSVCPVYEQTGNDCSVSRGKFIMLNGVIKGDLKLTKNINKYLDMCLKCNACSDFCPSDIDARKIFLTAKTEYFEKQPSSAFIKLFQSRFIFRAFLNLVKTGSNIYRTLNFDKFIQKFYPILTKFGWIGKKIILGNEFIKLSPHNFELISEPNQHTKSVKIPTHQSSNDNIIKAIYFKGCVNEHINPNAKNAVETILYKMGVNILPINFECCGLPFLSCGNAKQFKEQAEYNIRQIPHDFDYFLTDCASCASTFKDYKNYIEDPELLKKLDEILKKSINVNKFIISNVKKFEFKEKTTFTFHKPCHLENIDFLNEFLKKAVNAEYIQMKDFDKCCGFSGEFALKNTKLSEKISLQKAQNAINTKADYILTSCPSCVLGLKQGLIEAKTQKSKETEKNASASLCSSIVTSFTEFLAKSEIKMKKDYQNEDCSKELFDTLVKSIF